MRKSLIAVLIGLNFSPASAGTQIYVVKPGDTMGSVAADQMPGTDSIYKKNGRLAALLRANPKVHPADRVYVGTTLILPGLNEIDVRQPANEPARVVPESQSAPVAMQEVYEKSRAEEKAPPPLLKQEAQVEASFSPRLEIALGGSFVNLNSRDHATGASAVFASDIAPAFGVSLVQPFTNAWSIYGRFDYRDISFQQPTTQGSVQQPGSQKGLSAGVIRESRGVRVGVESGLRQFAFPRATAPSVYTFDRLTIPYAQVLLGFEPVQIGSSTLGLEGRYNYLGSSNSGLQRARSGKTLAGEVYWRHEFKSKRSYRLGVFYSKSEQDTNLSEQNQTQLGLGFNFVWPLGD